MNHSYYTLDGFTIDGQEELANIPFPTDLAAIDPFKDGVQSQVSDGRLIYVGAGDDSRDITGVTITNMFLNGAGGECVRLRNNAFGNAVADSVIQYCGMFGKGDDDDGRAYHNGEGVYIGTSPNSKKQPMHRDDGSSNNVVARNVIQTFGSECFNVKENAHDNVFSDNVCSGNTESAEHDGSNVELRGFRNVVRNNEISGSAGYTLKIKTDDEEYDKGGNVVENNRLSGSAAALMIESEAAQGPMCGNVVRQTTPGVHGRRGLRGETSPPRADPAESVWPGTLPLRESLDASNVAVSATLSGLSWVAGGRDERAVNVDLMSGYGRSCTATGCCRCSAP